MPIDHKLKEALRNAGQDGGKVVFGSGAPEPVVPAGTTMAAVTGDVKASVPKIANSDPLVNAAVGDVGSTVANVAADTGQIFSDSLVQPPEHEEYTEKVVLTEAERDAFLDALLSGKRYVQKFSLYNGRITGKLRCRSLVESEAVAAWMAGLLTGGAPITALEYAIKVRNALLAAQVLELNGTRYPELQAPLYPVKNGDAITPPGWIAAADAWSKNTDGKTPEAVVAAVYEELRTFERKYWTMVVHARDQNFWQPVEST